MSETDLPLSELHIDDVVFVDTEEALVSAVEDLISYAEVAFDTEGDNLSREGPLTIATFRGLGKFDARTYVVDVMALGGGRVFSKTLPSFRSLLEDAAFTKVTFDCRTDSDALLHQFEVRLSGVLELQVLDQAIRIHNGEAPPESNRYIKQGGLRYLQGMTEVLKRHSTDEEKLAKEPSPHTKSNSNVWRLRPLPPAAIKYAATDARVIGKLLMKMRETPLPSLLEHRVQEHSERYVDYFRSAEKSQLLDRDFVMEEHAICQSQELPVDHPMIPQDTRNLGQSKWNDAVMQLRGKQKVSTNKAYNTALFVLQHKDWYTDEGLEHMRQLTREFPFFTGKQRASLMAPKALSSREDDDDEGYGYDSDGGYDF